MNNDIYDENHTLNQSQRERHDSAIEYAKRGYPVLFTKGKRAVSTNGVKDATTITDSLTFQFIKQPTANIAVATGHKFWVVDIDVKPKDGIDGLKSLHDHFGDDFEIDPSNHMFQKTPSGGLHLFIELPDDGLPIPNSVGVLKGVDLRGLGTYIVMSPSGLMIDNKWKQYELFNYEDECFIPICKWTKEILRMGREKKSSNNDGLLNKGLTTGIGQGERDDSIFKLACQCMRDKVDKEIAYEHLCLIADKCNPPFSHEQVRKKVESAWSYQSDSGSAMDQIKNQFRSHT
ncbi:MAG: bifunctional DNA primase/polymerase [Gammaproteobacteria bacterium]